MRIDSSTKFAMQSLAQAYLNLLVLGKMEDSKALRDMAQAQNSDDPLIYEYLGDKADSLFGSICELIADHIEKKCKLLDRHRAEMN